MLESTLFYIFSCGALLGAVGVITARSAVYSVLSLVGSLCFLAGLFVLLKAYLVATVLVLVYAGAILVLFLFVVMLIDFRKKAEDWQGFKLSPLLAFGLGGLFFAFSVSVIRTLALPPAVRLEGTAEAVGRLLFRQYVLPFELTAFLILAAVVSVVVLAKKGNS